MEMADAVTMPLPMILEKARISGQDPGDWKKDNAMFIFKKARKGDQGNYSLSEQLYGAADTLEEWDAGLRDLKRLQQGAQGNLMRFH